MTPTLDPSLLDNYADQGWNGMDARSDTERSDPGTAKTIQNLWSDGQAELTVRPGMVGAFATVLGGPVYELAAMRQAGTTRVVFAARAPGDPTGPGRLWYTVVGSGTYTEITKAGAVRFAFLNGGKGVRLQRWGSYMYGIDADDSTAGVFRTDTTTAEVVTGLNAPTAAPVARLSSTVVQATAGDLANWGSIPAPSSTANLLGNPGFETNGGGISTTTIGTWTALPSVGEIEAKSALDDGTTRYASIGSGGTGYALYIDNAFDGVEQMLTSLPTISAGTTAISVPKLYLISLQLLDPAGLWAGAKRKRGVKLTVEAQDSGGAVLGTWQGELIMPSGSGLSLDGFSTSGISPVSHNPPTQGWPYETFYAFASFNNLPSNPAKFRFRLTTGTNCAPGPSSGVMVDNVSFAATLYSLILTQDGNRICATPSVPPNTPADVVAQARQLTGGLWVRRNYVASPKDFTANDVLAVRITLPSSVTTQTPKPRFRFGFQQSASTTVNWSNICSFTDDGRYIYVDTTTIASSVRASTQYFYIQLLDDLPGMADESGPAFSFEDVSAAGNLTLGLDIAYRVSGWKQVSGTTYAGNGVESLGSPYSQTLTPNGASATATVVLPVAPAGSTHFLLWKVGGVFRDGIPRLVAFLPVGANDTNWDYTTRTYTDNIGDSTLFDAYTYEPGRDAFPVGCTAIAEHQSRLWLAQGNTIYASWLLTEGREAGLYTTLAPDPADPSLPIKGTSFTLSTSGDAEPVVSLCPTGTVLLAFREAAVHIISGTDPTNLASQPYLKSAGIGNLARRGSAMVTTTAWFCASAGVMEFHPDTPVLKGLFIESLLKLSVLGASYRDAVMCTHDRRLFVIAAGDAFIWDTRQNGWTRWKPPTGVALVTAVSLSSGQDTGDFYMGADDGQIYLSTGNVDKRTPGGASLPIAWKLITRRYGFDKELWTKQRPTQVVLDLLNGDVSNVPATVIVRGINGPARSKALTVSPGRRTLKLRSWGDLRDTRHEVEISGSTTGRFNIGAVRLDATEGGIAAR
jgi:hypothetical protein